MIQLGADTLCWHLRLEQAGLTLPDLLSEAAESGAACIQLNLHHARRLSLEELVDLAADARDKGLPLLASGDFLGSPRKGDDVGVGVERIRGWLERAAVIGSPILRVASGFYRAELAGRPEEIELELRYVTDVLKAAAPEAEEVGIRLLLENHSDFSVAEYRRIIESVDGASVGVFLDLINAVAALENPVHIVEQLAPYAVAGHTKDYLFESIPTDDGYHRRGFSVLYHYPGEGVADHAALLHALQAGIGEGDFHLTIEGLDNRADVPDQKERLTRSLGFLQALLEGGRR